MNREKSPRKGKTKVQLFHELTYYTTAQTDPTFIHQHAVDAFAAQNANVKTKTITITFALVGLYLMLEKNFTGKEVQNAHIKMAKRRKTWPKFKLPEKKGDITIEDVLNTPPGPMRDEAIFKWSASIWEAYYESHEKVAYIVLTELWGEEK